MATGGCSKQEAPLVRQSAKPPEVSYALAVLTNVPAAIESVGHVSPFKWVAVRSQVSGVLAGVHFKEGDRVQKGDLLFTLDPRPFEDALKQAQGDLDKDLDEQNQASIEEHENAVLLQSRIVSKETYQASAAYAESLKAAISADKAALDTARLDLSNCFITAPISGRAGFIQASSGAVVQGFDTVLVTINQTQPVFVDFPMGESDLPLIRHCLESGARASVQAALPGHEQCLCTGELESMDNAIDLATGTVLVRARFANPDESLWPGQAVNTTLTTGTIMKAVLIPAQAVRNGTNGPFVFVMNTDARIQPCAIQTGQPLGNQVVVRNGLKGGERVIIAGAERLVPGITVRASQAAL
ncbi:MAG TPA: efflux RND transporter periplasmic adaptor subunit [Verrucomicrobiae bacterium]|nr:efflux RND transporter periplasmic adaptor subunit [Verrucomicrobiae bacterium]